MRWRRRSDAPARQPAPTRRSSVVALAIAAAAPVLVTVPGARALAWVPALVALLLCSLGPRGARRSVVAATLVLAICGAGTGIAVASSLDAMVVDRQVSAWEGAIRARGQERLAVEYEVTSSTGRIGVVGFDALENASLRDEDVASPWTWHRRIHRIAIESIDDDGQVYLTPPSVRAEAVPGTLGELSCTIRIQGRIVSRDAAVAGDPAVECRTPRSAVPPSPIVISKTAPLGR